MLTLRKRGRYWHVRGVLRVGQAAHEVKEHSTGATARDAAASYAAKLQERIERELLHGSGIGAAHRTLEMAVELYASRPGGLPPIDSHILGHLSDHVDFGAFRILDLHQCWREFCRGRGATLAPSTLASYRSRLQAAVNHACRAWGATPPVLDRIEVTAPPARFLSIEEQDRLLAAYHPRIRPLFTFLCFTGCRTQEALQIQWSAIDWRRRTAWFDKTKNGEARLVPLHGRVQAELLSLQHATGHVFLNRLGEPYSDTREREVPGGNPIAKTHQTALARALLSDFSPHDWRHHWASWMVMRGCDLITLQRLGGWKDPRMVKRYAALADHHLHDAIGRLE